MHAYQPTVRVIRRAFYAGAWVSAVMLGVTTFSSMSPAKAATVGTAQIVDPNTRAPLNSGTGGTPFTIKLVSPTGECTGDSANAGYRVQSYIVPESVDPSTLKFGSQGPTPSSQGSAGFKQPLYNTTGSAYAQEQTANADPPGGPGPITDIDTFDFQVWTPGDIPAGTYNVGIACTIGSTSSQTLDKYWNVKMTFATATASDANKAGVTWTAANGSTGATTTTTSTTVGNGGGATTTTVASGGTTTTSTTIASGGTTTTSSTIPGGGTSTTTTTAAGGGGTTTTTASSAAITLNVAAGRPGSSVTVTATGYAPGSQTQIYFLSDPVLLQTVAADGTGRVSAQVTIPSSATAGNHTIEVRGTGTNGAARTLSVPFIVTSTLARTGATVIEIVMWAVALVVFGTMAVVLSRLRVFKGSLRA